MSWNKQKKVFGKLLYLGAVWTLMIKYVLPISWALHEGGSWQRYIYFWDAWWIFHLYVGWGFLKNRNVWWPAFLLSLAEIGVIGIKFFFFASEPNWDFWHLNWFINKCFLLALFMMLALCLLQPEAKKRPVNGS